MKQRLYYTEWWKSIRNVSNRGLEDVDLLLRLPYTVCWWVCLRCMSAFLSLSSNGYNTKVFISIFPTSSTPHVTPFSIHSVLKKISQVIREALPCKQKAFLLIVKKKLAVWQDVTPSSSLLLKRSSDAVPAYPPGSGAHPSSVSLPLCPPCRSVYSMGCGGRRAGCGVRWWGTVCGIVGAVRYPG